MARKPDKHADARKAGGLPTKADIIAFINSSTSTVGKREISRAFGIKGADRIGLKKILTEMREDGTLAGDRKGFRERGGLPAVGVVEITGRDKDGDLIGEPVDWDTADGPRPKIRIRDAADTTKDRLKSARRPAQVGEGDRILARISPAEAGDTDDDIFYQAKTLKKLTRGKQSALGIYREGRSGGGRIEPVDRKQLKSWMLDPDAAGGAVDGELVRFDLATNGRHQIPHAKVTERLGNPHDQRQLSLIAIHAHGLPDTFPDGILTELDHLTAPTLDGRTDLRDTPLITIDPADARDHDDAVHATPDTDPANPGGHIVIVAIADVAHYVRPSSGLDREALKRGNSIYFPDRVVPMLPEKISNDLCSLREGEDRACLAVRMVFSADGRKLRHAFLRALMRSAAKLSYQDAQAAIDGRPSDTAAPLLEPVLRPLWAAYESVRKARQERGPLELDIPEKKIILDDEGRVARVEVPDRLDAHKLIEEFMIQSNVAAAETLEARKTTAVYRAHDKPSKEKQKSLRDFLATLDMKVPSSDQLRANAFNKILAKAKDMPAADLINEVVLRSQSQAEYTIENYGHFGLNLQRYAHFTSPIRRYADLVVHRQLIAALDLGDGAYSRDAAPPPFADIAQSISDAERRAMAAERETTDRLIAAHLAEHVGTRFHARISGVTRSGLFVRLKDTGADGFIPISEIGDDYFIHVEEAFALVGQRSGRAYRLGDEVEVKLVEAIPMAGALRFEMETAGQKGVVTIPKGAASARAGTGIRRGGSGGGRPSKAGGHRRHR